jgi:hypothetical protein
VEELVPVPGLQTVRAEPISVQMRRRCRGADKSNAVHGRFPADLEIANESGDQRLGLAEGKQVTAGERFGIQT